MNISKTLDLLRSSEFSFAYNKDNRFFYINNNPVSQKLKEEDIQNVYKYIITSLDERSDIRINSFDERSDNRINIDNVLINDVINAVNILCKENIYSPIQQAKEEKKLAEQKAKEEKKLADEREKEEEKETIIAIIKDKYKSISIDSYNRIRVDGEIYGGRKLDRLVQELMINEKIESQYKFIKHNTVKNLFTEVASLKKYVPKIKEEETFDDIINKINLEIDNNSNAWLNYIDSGTNQIYVCSLYMLYSDTYCGLFHFNINDNTLYYGDLNDDLVKINDTHIAEIRVNYTLKFKKEISKDTVLTSINNISRYITFNPFEIMLNNINSKYGPIDKNNWDGVDRVHELFTRFFYCEDNEYTRLYPELMLCQCIKVNLGQNMEDHKVDFAFFLFGEQGSGKTEFLQKLFFWNFYSPANLKDKMQLIYSLTGKILCFWDELKGLENEPIESIKEWITSPKIDQVRKFETYETTLLKTWVDVAATNKDYWFDDYGYERRFLCLTMPDKSGHRDEAYWNSSGFDDKYIDQVWLQAYNIYKEKYKNKRITVPKWFVQKNTIEQIKHNKIMNDQDAIEILTNLCKFKFSYSHYPENMKYLFKKQYNDMINNLEPNDTYVGSYLTRIDDYMIKVLFKRRDDKLKLMMTSYFGWKLSEYNDEYNKPRYYFTREIENILPDGLNGDS